MARFMEEYLPAFSGYGQPATANMMHDYFAPDVEFIGYVGLSGPQTFRSRDAFLQFDVAHPSSYERLTPSS
jgi:hypothetical protein